MAGGGKRIGAGKPRGAVKVFGGRPFVRSLVDNPHNRELVAKAFTRALRGVNAAEAIAAWDRMFQAAYGRPPQALDVRTANVNPNDQRIYRAVFDDGALVGDGLAGVAESLLVSAEAPE